MIRAWNSVLESGLVPLSCAWVCYCRSVFPIKSAGSAWFFSVSHESTHPSAVLWQKACTRLRPSNLGFPHPRTNVEITICRYSIMAAEKEQRRCIHKIIQAHMTMKYIWEKQIVSVPDAKSQRRRKKYVKN